MNKTHPIEGLMSTAMENLKTMIDVNTIVGEPIESPDGSIIITVSKVGFGFAAGGSEFGQSKPSENDQEEKPSLPFGGGSGGGVTITPIGFLIVNKQGVQMIHLDGTANLYEKLVDVAPQALEKIKDILAGKGKGQDKDN